MPGKTSSSVKPCPICGKPHAYGPAKALQTQSQTPRRIAQTIQGLTTAQLKKRPAPGKWSISEVLHHLADCEIVYGVRTRLMLAERRPSLTPFDQDAWAVNLAYAKGDPKLAFQAFEAARRQNVANLRRISPAAWERTGLHAEYGNLKVIHLIRHLTEHDVSHLAQLAKVKAQIKGSRPAGGAQR
ncbi:MAG: DinB family protein [Acidobacteria bacterium]|nr:DinB family protein [Acidobacteriota bacterium]